MLHLLLDSRNVGFGHQFARHGVGHAGGDGAHALGGVLVQVLPHLALLVDADALGPGDLFVGAAQGWQPGGLRGLVGGSAVLGALTLPTGDTLHPGYAALSLLVGAVYLMGDLVTAAVGDCRFGHYSSSSSGRSHPSVSAWAA